MNENQNSQFLGKEKISKLMLKFSIPCVLSLLVSALYNIVDQIFIGARLVMPQQALFFRFLLSHRLLHGVLAMVAPRILIYVKVEKIRKMHINLSAAV